MASTVDWFSEFQSRKTSFGEKCVVIEVASGEAVSHKWYFHRTFLE